MNRFIKSSLLVGALLSVTGVSLCVPAQADNNQQKYLNNMAVQMYANNVANGMSPLTGGIYSPYVNGAINQGGHHHRNNNNYNNYNAAYNNGYYNPNYGYQNYGYGSQYQRPSVFSQLIRGVGY
jgi:hypothetical protein